MDDIVRNNFLSGNISKLIAQTSIPMVGAILALFAYELLESTLVALSGSNTLTALGFTLPITTAMTAIAIGVGIRSNNHVVKYACLHKDKIAQTIVLSLISSSVLVIFLSVIALFLHYDILALLGNKQWATSKELSIDNSLLEQQTYYMTSRYISWVGLALVWQVNAILRAIGYMKTASTLMLAWLSSKALLAALLLLPQSQWYQDGLSGLAYIHIISDSVFALISIAVLMRKTSLKSPSLIDVRFAYQQFRFSHYTVILQQLITPISMATLTIIAGKIDYSYISAFALLFRLESLFLLLPMVLTTSMPAIIGTNFWSGHSERVNKIYLYIFSIIIVIQLIIAFIVCTNNEFIASLVCPQNETLKHVKQYLIWVPWGYTFAGCAIVYQSCLNAEGKCLEAVSIGLLHRIFLLLPFAYIGATSTTSNYFFQGIMVGHLSIGFYLLFIFMRKKELSKKHIENINCNTVLTSTRKITSP